MRAETSSFRVIGAVSRVLVAPEDPEELLRLLADPAIRIVSLTITEKGYCRDAATGALDEGHPDIRHDLAGAPPRSALGYLVEALRRRRAAGVAPFTVLSCDNLPANGAATSRLPLPVFAPVQVCSEAPPWRRRARRTKVAIRVD